MSWIKEKWRRLCEQILREKASPQFIARGWAIGMFYGCLIPFGFQLIKMAGFALWPFGRDVHSDVNDGGCLSIIMNVLWILLGGIEVAMIHVTFGLVCCITIVGIPFGMQHFKMALLALVPFGKTIS